MATFASAKMSDFDLEQARNYMFQLLSAMHDAGGSDLFITTNFPPSMNLHGRMVPLTDQRLPAEVSRQLIEAIMTRRQRDDLVRDLECNFAIAVQDVARFRVNVFVQQQNIAAVMRAIPSVIPEIDELGLPDSLKKIVESKRGLVLLVGATGSGKSTSLAAMINHRNRTSTGHIVTVEDPVEFVHPSQNCLVSHREVGIDTHNWHNALKNALRQAPDVILIGEIRDRETMEHAIAFAETGHLCLGTLHANSASQTMDRIVNFFPEDRRRQVLMDLSSNLRAVISQRLVRAIDGNGRKCAVEVLINTPTVAERLLNGEFHTLKEIMGRSRELGMRTFDWALFELYNEGHIDYIDALKNADSENELRLAIKLKSSRGEPKEAAGLALSIDQEEWFTPEELAAHRAKELERQEARRKELERERLEADYQKNKLFHERRRKKEDEVLRQMQAQKGLQANDDMHLRPFSVEMDTSPA
jgi:twitching motility protein PilU